MYKIIVLIILFFINTGLYAQVDSFIIGAEKSTVCISGYDMKNQPVAGTGFFIWYNDFIYLVTAQHVADGIVLNPSLTFNDSSNNVPRTISLSDIQKGNKIEWVYNKGGADVAVLAINPESPLLSYNNFKAFPMSWLLDTLIAPGRYKDVLCFGFPLSLGIQRHFSPISTSSKIASGLIDLSRFDNNKIASFFLLDAPSIPGLSGGPVFAIPSFLNPLDSTTLVGLVHGVISDNTGGKFAAIVPAYFIAETIRDTKLFSGISIIYYPDGKVWTEKLYINGYLDSVISNFSSSGKQQYKGTLKHGNGFINIYNDQSKLILKVYFENGRFIKQEKISN